MYRGIISFSLFGSAPLYLRGAERNADLIHSIYPGWTARFYVSQEIPEECVQRLRASGAEVIPKHRSGRIDGMFWRFLPAAESQWDAMLVRDVDSRLSLREHAAVMQWLESGKKLHILRDHPNHRVPILGGMWGCRGGAVPDMAELVDGWKLWAKKGQDQDFLRDVVYTRFRSDCLVHSDLYAYGDELRLPFPTPRLGSEFVGSIIDPDRDDLTPQQSAELAVLFANATFQQLPSVRPKWKWMLWLEQWLRSWRRPAA
jgi:hypothetical protein